MGSSSSTITTIPLPIHVLELIRAHVKTDDADRNKTLKLANVQKIVNEVTDKVTVEDWEKFVRHTERLHDDDFVNRCNRDNITETIIINLRDRDSNTDNYNDS
jgi:hypothetical protein